MILTHTFERGWRHSECEYYHKPNEVTHLLHIQGRLWGIVCNGCHEIGWTGTAKSSDNLNIYKAMYVWEET
jgi:hypothetical protein